MSVLADPSDLAQDFIEQCRRELASILTETLSSIPAEYAKTQRLLVIGCSTSEVAGGRIGARAYANLGGALAETALTFCRANDLHLAAQCCEHLNRALVVSAETALQFNLTRVLAVPTPEAGGSFAASVYAAQQTNVLVREAAVDLGLDIGGTLIGMHIRRIAVPLRLTTRAIGHARVTAAYARPEYIGGARAKYL